LEQQDDAGFRPASFRLQQHCPEDFSSSPHRHANVGFPQFPVGTPTVETTYASSVAKLHTQRRDGNQNKHRQTNTASSSTAEGIAKLDLS
jgi:hypothetical protein